MWLFCEHTASAESNVNCERILSQLIPVTTCADRSAVSALATGGTLGYCHYIQLFRTQRKLCDVTLCNVERQLQTVTILHCS